MCSKDAKVEIAILTRSIIVPFLENFALPISPPVLFCFYTIATDGIIAFTDCSSVLPHRMDVIFMNFLITQLKYSNGDASRKLKAPSRDTSSTMWSGMWNVSVNKLKNPVLQIKFLPTFSVVEYLHSSQSLHYVAFIFRVLCILADWQCLSTTCKVFLRLGHVHNLLHGLKVQQWLGKRYQVRHSLLPSKFPSHLWK